MEDDEARLMRDYRAQLDAERAKKLARGSNHATLREKVKKGTFMCILIYIALYSLLCYLEALVQLISNICSWQQLMKLLKRWCSSATLG